MASTRYFLDADGLKFLAAQLVGKMDLKINSRMVTLIDEESTNDEIPSAQAVYDLLQESLSKISGVDFEVVEDLPGEGEPGIIYLIKADPEDGESNVYVQWVYVGESWINLGTSEIDLDNYWSKDELEPITNGDILGILEEVFGTEDDGDDEEEDPEP